MTRSTFLLASLALILAALFAFGLLVWPTTYCYVTQSWRANDRSGQRVFRVHRLSGRTEILVTSEGKISAASD